MLEPFITYRKKENLFNPKQKVLLAISGGLDSMVMLHLFRKAGYYFSVAHCNFQLREKESDGDEQFVRNYCDEYNIQLFVNHFTTQEYALQEGISIEMAARELRYNWFFELLEKENFDCLATAHHQDDVIETFFLNLNRGTGIRGLSGIKPKTGKLIRPMLFTSREDIEKYANIHNVEYREDSSNRDIDIKRNFMRHEVLPLLDNFNSAFRKNILKTTSFLNQTQEIFQQKIDDIKTMVSAEKEKQLTIDIASLKQFQPLQTILFELLRKKDFTSEVVNEIIEALDGISGKKFYSSTHRLVKDREQLIVTPLETGSGQIYYIEEDCIEIDHPLKINFLKFPRTDDFLFSTDPMIADVDLEKLEFPLILRKWKQGEYFQPLGMEGFKKISDFFIDEKYSIPEKENTWILASGDKVVWIIGKRIDNRFKIDKNTTQVFRVSI